MSAKLLSGKPCADDIYRSLRSDPKKNSLYTVGLDDPQWLQYVGSLVKSGEKCGINVKNILLKQGVAPTDMFETVSRACLNDDIAGLLLEQPLPKEYAPAANYVLPQADVDCVNPLSVAAMYKGERGFRPATPSAVIRLLDFYGITIEGKHVVIVGRGNAVGKPLAIMMLARNATVTVCHTKTTSLPAVCKTADILVSACGAAGLITSEFVTEKTVAIDVGLSFVNCRSMGDIAPDAYDVCQAASPVPGGIGPVTRAVLFENIMKASESK